MRVHLPIASKCNIECNYCERYFDPCIARPGITSKIIDSADVLEYVSVVDKENSVIGIAGPGEPLFNPETFKALEMLSEFKTCLCTNGLLLEDFADTLKRLNLKYLSITINALSSEVAQKIYGRIFYSGNYYESEEAAKILLNKQKSGLNKIADKGIHLKINTIFIPGVNEYEIIPIAKMCKEFNVNVMNIMPIIPLNKFKNLKPDLTTLIKLRKEASEYVRQKDNCAQCRADAMGHM